MHFQIENLLYDDATGIVVKQNKELKLTNIQKKLFNYFIAHPKQIISKETLMQEVWGRIVTENTINKFISKLRSYIEDNPSQPKLIVTRFGHGLSFEGDIKTADSTKTEKSKLQTNKFLIVASLAILLVVAIVLWINYSKQNLPKQLDFKLQEKHHVLILPTNFQDIDISEIQQLGLSEYIQSSFNNTETEGQMVFDQTQLDNRGAIEKYWQFDKKLMVLQSKVLRNGDIYESVIKLSQGAKVLDETIISANSLNDLLKNQANYISNYQNNNTDAENSKTQKPLNTDILIEALGYKKLGNIAKAKQLLLKVLQKQENQYQARFELAKIYIQEKQYVKSLAQLNTLKSTKAYKIIGSEIELAISEIQFIKHEYNDLITNLQSYLVSNLGMSEVKKAKIKIQVANSYLALGDLQKAMKSYKQAIMDINGEFNPDLYTQSYYGQGQILLHQSNNQDVYQILEQSLYYAQSAGNLKYQILSLDEMAKMLLVSNQWDKGIALKRQALEIMELVSDKSEVAQGLGTLAAFLIQSGQFTEAKQINDRMGAIAQELNLDTLTLSYLHYDIVLLLNVFKFDQAELKIKQQLALAIEKNNYGMQLDNAFLEFELRLAKKDTLDFKPEWDKRTQMIKDLGFERYQVYMDLYLARYYKQISNVKEANILFSNITELAKSTNDIKILVDAKNQQAEMYLDIDAKKSLEILENIAQYKPDANPYLELKALAMNKLNRKIEALNLLNQAKLLYHEAWKSENQVLLEKLQAEVSSN